MSPALIRELLLKEIRQHYWAFAALVGVSLLLAGALIVEVATRDRLMSAMELYAWFLGALIPIASLVLAHRMVVLEYRRNTHRWLERLPLRRWQMTLAQFLIGSVAISVLCVWGFVLVLTHSWRHDVLTLELVGALLIRGLCAGLWIWASAFCISFAGRYRWFLLIFYVMFSSMFGAARIGAPGMIPAIFTLEKQVHGVHYALAGVSILVLLGLSLIVSSVLRRGFATWIAREMSTYERLPAATGVLGVAALSTILFVRCGAPTVTVPEDFTRYDHGSTSVLLRTEPAPEQAELLRGMAERLDGLRQQLGHGGFTLVLADRRWLDRGVYTRATPATRFGFKVRLNMDPEVWDVADFEAYIAEQYLLDASSGRAGTESRGWLLAAAPLHLAHRDAPAPPHLLRAAKLAAEDGGLEQALDRPWAAERRLGTELYRALAWSGLRTLEEARGHERVDALLAASFPARPPAEVTAAIMDWMSPPRNQLQVTTGWRREELLRAWRERLGRVPESETPRLNAVFELHSAGRTARVRYALDWDTPPPPGTAVEIRWAEVEPLQQSVPPRAWERLIFLWKPDRASDALPGSFTSGTRLEVEAAYEAKTLDGIELIAGRRRIVVP